MVISTGRAQDEGRGDTDWDGDGNPDLVRWRFTLTTPPGSETLRFTTQFITSDINIFGRTVRDTVSLFVQRATGSSTKTVGLDGVAGLSLQKVNSPVSHGIRVDDVPSIALIFEVKDGGTDGKHDSALVISNLYFSEVPLPEGADWTTVPPTPEIPEILSNPSPQNTSTIAGTYSYENTLYSVPGVGMPFEFSIRYNSASTLESESLGPKWAHSYEATLQKAQIKEDPDGDDVPDDVDLVIVHLGNGLSEYFRCAKPSPGPYSCTTSEPYEPKYAGVYSTLSQTAAGSYTYETKDHLEYVFDVDLDHPDGETADEYEKYALKTITDSNGNVITLNYDANNRLDYVLDTRGTVFTFNHDSDGRLLSVENPQGGGGGVSFEHVDHIVDGELTELLASFTDLNGYVTSFTYDQKANLLTCTDGDGTVFASNDYEQYQSGAGAEQLGDRTVARRNANPGDPGMLFTFSGESVYREDRVSGFEETRYDVKAREYDRSVFLGTNGAGAPCTQADPDLLGVVGVGVREDLRRGNEPGSTLRHRQRLSGQRLRQHLEPRLAGGCPRDGDRCRVRRPRQPDLQDRGVGDSHDASVRGRGESGAELPHEPLPRQPLRHRDHNDLRHAQQPANTSRAGGSQLRLHLRLE